MSPEGVPYPAAYGLLANKGTESYRAFFSHLKKLCPDGPEHVVVDLESAPISVYREMWPGVIVEACLFHWKQALR